MFFHRRHLPCKCRTRGQVPHGRWRTREIYIFPRRRDRHDTRIFFSKSSRRSATALTRGRCKTERSFHAAIFRSALRSAPPGYIENHGARFRRAPEMIRSSQSTSKKFEVVPGDSPHAPLNRSKHTGAGQKEWNCKRRRGALSAMAREREPSSSTNV